MSGKESFLVQIRDRFHGGWYGQIIDHDESKYKNEKLKEVVYATLHDSDEVDASRIEVMAFNGNVILGGTVKSLQEKNAALKMTGDLLGVIQVHNGLIVVT